MNRPRLRFAPSPTGYLHVGGARTILFNWLYAKHIGGEFVLRIEDTDTERNRPELTENIFEMIRWLGLDWDGEPVHQSDRFDLYRKAATQLFASGRAYACDCEREAIDARAKERGGPPGYDGFCRDRGLEPGEGRALRFRAPDDGTTTFDDLVRGTVEVDNKTIEDFVLLRSNGTPTFLLANIVDDHDMAITHVVRAEEHINGTPKYLLLADALGLDYLPVFAHVPMLVNEQRRKLSKRKDSVSVAEFKDRGFLPEAMVNYLATLGWGPRDGVEIRPLAEIVAMFELTDVTSSPAFFDTQKLEHFNGEYIRMLTPERFVTAAAPFLSRPDGVEVLTPLAEEIRDRVKRLDQVEPMIAFLFDDELEVDETAWAKGVVKHGEAAITVLDAAAAGLAELADWEADGIRAAIEDAARAAGFVNAEGNVQMSKAQSPIRVATTGQTVGPPLFESLAVLGRERTVDRLRAARARL